MAGHQGAESGYARAMGLAGVNSARPLQFSCFAFEDRNMKLFISVLLLATSIGSAVAQSMMEVDLVGQPLSYSKDGVVNGCGVRVVGVISPVPGDKAFKSFDVSANLWKSGQALVKMIGEETPVADPIPSKTRRVSLRNGWLKAEGKTPAAPIGGDFRASTDDKGAYLFPVAFDGSIEFILAAARNERVQVAIRRDAKAEWIYSGMVRLSDLEKNQILNCLKEVLN